jgi:hypothetical protein
MYVHMNVPLYSKYWLDGDFVKTETCSQNYVLLIIYCCCVKAE